MYFIILAPELERAFGIAMFTAIHLRLGGKHTLHCCTSSHIFRTEKAFQHIKLIHLRMHFASGSLL